MRRAGWEVWIAYDLPGSYEEMPPNLLDELKRDRRWCQGNLMNSRLFFDARPASGASRGVRDRRDGLPVGAAVVPVPGAVDRAARACTRSIVPTVFRRAVPAVPALAGMASSDWAIGAVQRDRRCCCSCRRCSASLLIVAAAARGASAARCGLPAACSVEIVFSVLLAPVRMLFHTQFVVAALTGWRLHWKSPPREDAETTWREALRRHGAAHAARPRLGRGSCTG